MFVVYNIVLIGFVVSPALSSAVTDLAATSTCRNLTEATVSHERYKRQSQCGLYQWRCTDGTCIAGAGKCDGRIDCPDRSDETHALCRNFNLATVSGKCVLPPYPEHGIYVVNNNPYATPGQRIEYAQLNVTCEQGFGVAGNAVPYCLDGTWFIPIQKCIPFCRLDPDISVRYNCHVPGTGSYRTCNQFEPTGTLVKPECNTPIYGSRDLLLSMTCGSDGNWNRIIKCVPECGRVTPFAVGLIWGSTEVIRGELPWHVAIYRKPTQKTNYYEQICGESIVSNRIVISAAHCFWDNFKQEKQAASKYAVAAAKLFREWDNEDDTNAQKSELKSIELTPYYRGVRTNYQHDIAVLILQTPFVYHNYVRPVCLDLIDSNFNSLQLQVGNFGKVAGWGLTDENGPASPILTVAQLPFVPIPECIRITPQTFTESITGDKICAGYNNGTAAVCRGDSGGGLSFPDTERGTTRYYLRGVVSTAPRVSQKCNVFTVTTFTEIYQHKEFINQFMSATWCTLPPYPKHGSYEVVGNPAVKPGDDVENVYLKVSCNHGYGVIGSNVVQCSLGDWSTRMPECVQGLKGIRVEETRCLTSLDMDSPKHSSTWRGGECVDFVIEIPDSGDPDAPDSGHYRLDYQPPYGSPAPNFTVPARAKTVNFVGMPGTKYQLMLYYSNATFADLLTWNQTVITAPKPPTNLTVTLGRYRQASVSWSPPALGDYTGFRFEVISLTEDVEGFVSTISVDGAGDCTSVLRELSPGATYQVHAFTLLHDKESSTYSSRNFTTKPNKPGRILVWFRDETSLLMLWQPPYPAGSYTYYKASIMPADALESILYVKKEGDPPGPAMATFKGLVPGRAYDFSVQTVSEPEISAPSTAQYRTIPLSPRYVTAPLADIKETSFKVTWLPPLEESDFDRYQLSVSSGVDGRRFSPVERARNETLAYSFEGLQPGVQYTVTVKTMSGKVSSWSANTNLTLKPLAVDKLRCKLVDADAAVWWVPGPNSTQDEYIVSYHEVGSPRDDSNTLLTPETRVTLRKLLPGRNYSVNVVAVSGGVASEPRDTSVATQPLAPMLLPTLATQSGLMLSWRPDVNSREDHYELRYRRYRRDKDNPDNFETLTTTNTSAKLEGLFPGAVYQVQLAAVSHGLQSEQQRLLKPVRPMPARSLRVVRGTSNSVVVAWAGPARAQSALGGFVLRYRTRAATPWLQLSPLKPSDTEAEIRNLTHGEEYLIRLDTLSEDADGETVESDQPLQEEHILRPYPLSDVEELVDNSNMMVE